MIRGGLYKILLFSHSIYRKNVAATSSNKPALTSSAGAPDISTLASELLEDVVELLAVLFEVPEDAVVLLEGTAVQAVGAGPKPIASPPAGSKSMGL